jgi:hypothetical protein
MSWWIKLNTQITEHWLWDSKPFSKGQAWVDLLLMAETYTHSNLWRGNLTEFKKGDVCRSFAFLADRWGWNRKAVKRFLSVLEDDQMVTLNVTKRRTTITIVNYGKFQNKGTSDGTSDGTSKVTSDGTSKGTSDGTHYKSIKSNKNKRVKEKEKPLRGKYFEDPNEFLNDTKYLDDYLECESFAHEDVERAVLIRRMELGLDDPNDENVKKRRKELGLDE